MEAIDLHVSGTLNLEVIKIHNGQFVGEKVQNEVREKLKNGDYIISLANRTICSLEDLESPLYSFTFEVGGNTEYEFD